MKSAKPGIDAITTDFGPGAEETAFPGTLDGPEGRAMTPQPDALRQMERTFQEFLGREPLIDASQSCLQKPLTDEQIEESFGPGEKPDYHS